MRIFAPLLYVLIVAATPLLARPGKVFFSGDRWMKGDIQERTEENGRRVVVVALPSGSFIFDRSEIKTIVYSPGAGAQDRRFIQALNNTPSSKSFPSAKTPVRYEEVIREASAKHNMDPALVKAVIKQESNFNRTDVSNKGAEGLMQLMPGTARGLGVKDAFDPWENVHGGTLYLKYMLDRFNGNLPLALAAYNAGPGAVQRHGKIPPYRETQDYVRRVMGYYHFYSGEKLRAFTDRKGSLVFTDQPYLPK